MSTSSNLETSKSLPVKALCADENIDEYVSSFVEMLNKHGFSIVEKSITDEFVKIRTIYNVNGFDVIVGFLANRGMCKMTIILKFKGHYSIDHINERNKPLIDVIKRAIENAKLMVKQMLNIDNYTEELFYCHDKVDASYEEESNTLVLRLSLPITKEDIKELKSCLEEIFIGEQQ